MCMWAVSRNLNILILLCFTKASAYFSLLCKGYNTPNHTLYSFSPSVVDGMYLSDQTNWLVQWNRAYNVSQKVGSLTCMSSVCGANIFKLSLTSSYCSLPNAKRALHTGTPSYGNIQWDDQINANTTHIHYSWSCSQSIQYQLQAVPLQTFNSSLRTSFSKLT